LSDTVHGHERDERRDPVLYQDWLQQTEPEEQLKPRTEGKEEE